MARSKGAAAALDFFIWGSGHAFFGYRKALGLPWIIWTLLLVVFTIVASYESQFFYYVDTSSGFPLVAYDTGKALTIDIVPYLVIGGLLIFDLIRKGALPAIGPFGAQEGQAVSPPAVQQTQTFAPVAALACPSCGTSVTRGDTFCPSCGTKLLMGTSGMPTPVAAGGASVCNNCGTANPQGYVFCKRCGSSLAK